MTNRLRQLLLITLVVGASTARAGNLPEAFPAERYAQLSAQSPFAPATPVTKQEQPAFTQQLYITGLTKIGGRDCVFLASRAGQEQFTLRSGEPGPDGIQIERIEWASEPGRSKVYLRKGAEKGEVQFDQAVLQSAPPPAPPQAAGAKSPIALPQPQPGTPHLHGPQATPPGQGQVPTRRRIRIINNRP